MAVISISRCPHCNARLNIEVKGSYHWVREEVKAPDIYRCIKCSGLISTGESEWLDKSESERRSFIIKKSFVTLVTSVFVGFILTMITGVFLFQEYLGIKLNLFLFIILFLFFAGGIAVTNYLGYKKEIKDSIKRTSRRHI